MKSDMGFFVGDDGVVAADTAGEYILIRDQKASGVHGGTFTAGAWQTRELNTVVQDDTGEVLLAANQFLLPAGTYEVLIRAPAFFCNSHKVRLRNITAGSTVDEGTSEKSNDDSTNSESTQESVLHKKFTIAGPTIFEVQHRCETTTATNGFGTATSFATDNEIYTVVKLRRVPDSVVSADVVEPDYMFVREEAATTVDGGGSTSGSYETRVLDTEVVNNISGASLASNQITLPAGKYRIRATASAAAGTGQHKAKLRNVTDGVDLLIGESSFTNTTIQSGRSYVYGQFTILGTKLIELLHRTTNTTPTNGHGDASGAGVIETYSEVEIRKVA